MSEENALIKINNAKHPLKLEREFSEVAQGLTCREILEKFQPDAVMRRHAVIQVDGYPIPRNSWDLVKPKAGSNVEISLTPKGGGGGGGGGGKLITKILLTIVLIVVAVATFGAAAPYVGATIAALYAGGLFVGGMLLINAIAPARPQNMNRLSATPGGGGADAIAESPTLFIEGARNQARPFSPVPFVLGRHRAVPPFGAQPYTEVVGEEHYIRMIFVWGAGNVKIDLDSLKIGETPITEFDGVQIEHREGLPDDEPLTLYPSVIAQENLSVLLEQATGYVIRNSGLDADELSIDITFNRGLVLFDSGGARSAQQVQIEVDYRKVGDVDWLTPVFTATTVPSEWISGKLITFTHQKPVAIRHGFRWKPDTAGQYEIRIRRVTPDATNDQIIDDTAWTALRTIRIEDVIQSPVPLAKTALIIKATNQLNQVIDEFNGIVTSVGYGMDSSGWVADQEVQNPASLFRLVLQGYGTAVPMSDERLDLDALADWYDFCEERGYKFNMIRDFNSSVWETLKDVCFAGRAAPTIIDGKWSVVIDRSQASPVSHITPRNSFNFTVEKMFLDLPHAWRIRFNNEEQGFRQDERRVYRTGYNQGNATKFESLEIPGVTDPTQIQRLGRFQLLCGEHRPERWSWNQDMEYLTYRRGDKVKVTHDVLLVGLGSGRVKSVELDSDDNVVSIAVDEELTIEAAKEYGVAIRGLRNASITRKLSNSVGTTKVLYFADPIPPEGGDPAVKRGNVFGFGLFGQETDDGLIVSITPRKNFLAEVSAVPYREEVYDTESEEVTEFETNLTPLTPIPTPTIRNVVSDESALAVGLGESLRVRIFVDFDPISSGFDSYSVETQIRPSTTREPFYAAQVDEQGANRVVIGGVRDGEVFDIRIRFRVPGRMPGSWATVNNHLVVGKSTPPQALQGMTISVFGGSALIRWDTPPELDVRFGGVVHFRHSPVFVDAEWSESVSIGDVAQARSLVAVLPLKPGTYLARVFDESGNPSEEVSFVTTKQASVLEYANLDELQEDPDFIGVHANTVGSDGILKLAGAGMFDDIQDLDDVVEVPNLDAFGGLVSEGLYEFFYGFDLGAVKRVRLTTDVNAISVSIFDLMDGWLEPIDTREDFDGTNQSNADCIIEVRHTDDDPSDSSAEFSAWERLDSAEFEARGFQFRAKLSTSDAAFNVHVSKLKILTDEVAA